MPLILVRKQIIAPVGFVPTYFVYANKFAALLCEVFDVGAKLACTTSGMRVIWTGNKQPVRKFFSTGEAAVTNLLFYPIRITQADGIEAMLANLPATYKAGSLEIPVTTIQLVITTKTHFQEYVVVAP